MLLLQVTKYVLTGVQMVGGALKRVMPRPSALSPPPPLHLLRVKSYSPCRGRSRLSHSAERLAQLSALKEEVGVPCLRTDWKVKLLPLYVEPEDKERHI